jgi:hypothetical protein
VVLGSAQDVSVHFPEIAERLRAIAAENRAVHRRQGARFESGEPIQGRCCQPGVRQIVRERPLLVVDQRLAADSDQLGPAERRALTVLVEQVRTE